MRVCRICKKRPMQKHHNAKYCLPCALERRSKPKGTLTDKQKAWVRSRIGKAPITEMAKRLKTSVANIKRSLPGVSIWFHNGKHKNNPRLVREVLAYYSKHGRVATEKAFPSIKVRSIVEHADLYGVRLKPRQIRWKEHEIVSAARMAGLVSFKNQAKFFNRPRANAGSVHSLWAKRFKAAPSSIHGMTNHTARHILRPGYPLIKLPHSQRRAGQKGPAPRRGIVLWCEMGPWLKRGTPAFIRDGVKTMAQFQCWLFEAKDPRSEIHRLLDLQWRVKKGAGSSELLSKTTELKTLDA